MRRAGIMLVLSLVACGASERTGGFEDEQNATPASSTSGSSSGGGSSFGASSDGGAPNADASTTTTTTIYANSDDTLYSLDPATNAVKIVGKMSGADGAVTDCAVNEAGDVFVNTTSTIYKATLGSSVTLQKIAAIAEGDGQRFYALAFVPAGVLGSGETLVGGDGNGEIWSIDPQTGATKDLGSFGPDKTNVFALSGDLVFYRDGSGKPTGLATIRSCKPGGSCTTTNDYLAGIDMNALAAAWSSGTPAKSLLSGIYGGSSASKGNGTGHGALYGLGAWEGTVFAFERASANGGTPAMLTVDTASGKGAMVSTSGMAFENGWSGACVTTKVTVTVPPPPAAPN